MIIIMKDTTPGFLSHDLPFRKFGKGGVFDSLIFVMAGLLTYLSL